MVFKPRCDIWQYFDNIVEEGVAVCKLCKQRLKNYSSYVLRRHIQKLHNANSEVWKYFDNLVGEGLAVCKQCQHRVRNNRSFNLKQHLQVSHNIIVNDIDESFTLKKPTARTSKEVDSTLENINDDESSEETPVSTNFIQETLNESISKRRRNDIITIETNPFKRFLDIEMGEKILMSAIWGLMLDDGVTPILFGSKNMQSIIKPIYKAISVQENKEFKIDEFETEKLLDFATKHMKNDFSSNLNWRLLSLKIDMDLNGPAKTFCVSTSFIHEEKIEERVLGVIDLKDDSQLNEKHIKKILNKHNIDSSQIINICCDFSKTKYNTKVENFEYLKEIENFEKYPDINFGDLQIERYVGAVAQLSLLDIFKNSDVFQPFQKCRNFVKFINDTSNGFVDIFQHNNLNVPELDSPYKWGSTYKMIHDLQQARNILNDINYPKIENLGDQFEVNDDMWLFIDGFCEALKFIQKSITKYYSEEIHFGDFYAQWLKSKLLTAKLASNTNTQNKYLAIISKALLICIEARSKDILSKDYFKACLYLDPRFHITLGYVDKLIAIDYLKKLWSLSKIYNPDVINSATEYQEEPAKSQHFNDDEDAFLNEFLSQDALKPDTRTNSVYNIIEQFKLPFKSVDTNILLFWRSLKSVQPQMYALSAICFAIPTTQIYNKNRYSHIYKAETISNLPTLTRDNIVSIRLNPRLVENSLKKFGISYEGNSSDDEVELVDSNEMTNDSF